VDFLCPLPVEPEDCTFLPRLREALVMELYRQSRVSLACLAILTVLMRLIVAGAVVRAEGLRWIFPVLGATLLLRAAWIGFLARFSRRDPSAGVRFLVFLAGSTLTSGCLVLINLIAIPALNVVAAAMLCICQAGISATAMVGMSGSPIVYALYMVPMIGSLIVVGIRYPPPELATVLVVMLALFLVTQLGVALTLHRTLRDNVLGKLKLEHLAKRDQLTGLRNRRYLQDFMEAEQPRMQRSWHPDAAAAGVPVRNLGFIMVDLDHFKAVNDTYGHAAGDEVLKQVARVLKASIRTPDLLIRMGGEEFLILSLDASRTMPMTSPERIREAMARHLFRLPSGEVLHKTCSIGYAIYPFQPSQPDQFSWEDVLNLADGALYRAKHAGRNRAIGVVPGTDPQRLTAELFRDVENSVARALAQDALRQVEGEL
jgi:diguanylate cyclase (GGDEF)-like protein